MGVDDTVATRGNTPKIFLHCELSHICLNFGPLLSALGRRVGNCCTAENFAG